MEESFKIEKIFRTDNLIKGYAGLMATVSDEVWEKKLKSETGIFKPVFKHHERTGIIGPSLNIPNKEKEIHQTQLSGQGLVIETMRFFSKASEEQRYFFQKLKEHNFQRAIEYMLAIVNAIKIWELDIKRILEKELNLLTEEEIFIDSKTGKQIDNRLKKLIKIEEQEEDLFEDKIEEEADIKVHDDSLIKHLKDDLKNWRKNPASVVKFDEEEDQEIVHELEELDLSLIHI